MSVDVATLSPLKRALIEIRDLKARLARAERRAGEPIAIVGMGLRLPGGANDPDSFWQLLWNGVDAITEVPAERWPIADFFDPDPDAPGKMTTRHGGFLADIDRFDPAFFGISPREAESMDPQQRLLLEVAWEALEHAGVDADSLFGTNAGVYVGMGNSDYLRLLLADHEQIDAYTTTGNALSIAAGRIAYVLGAQGPAVTVDTACSSSLVAVHLAVQALRRGDTDIALAGGVSLMLGPELTINFSRARMLAADGRCKTFDASADGYVRSEGCALVALERMSDAEARGHQILAVIRGTAAGQDGRSGGLTAPNGPAQEQVIAAALADAGLDANAVGYVEAHGTGTPLGDPIEVRALASALARRRPADDPLLLGSVKTNLGHMEAAAGVGGLIKLVLMLQHGAIPPHLHLHQLNEHIAGERAAIAVPTTATPWPPRPGGRVGGVSSFGLSGTNAHVIVAEAPPREPVAPPAAPERSAHLLTLSARTPSALAESARRYRSHLAGHPDHSLPDVAFSANTGRAQLPCRLAIVAGDGVEAARLLDDASTRDLDEFALTTSPPDVTFLFTGHGSHHAGMGLRLYDEQPVFRAAMARCEELLRPHLDQELRAVLASPALLADMAYAQPALFALQYALAELWRSWGARPTTVAGHSAGEYAAAVQAGVLDLEDGIRLICARGKLLSSIDDDGEMVAVFADEVTVAAAVAGHEDDVAIAAVNGPATTVISGRRAAVRAVLSDLHIDDDDWRVLDVSVGAHSPLVDPILDEFEAVVSTIPWRRPEIGLVSSLTGAFVDGEVTETGYWRRHLRQPVRFAAVFDTLHDAGVRAFVEIGPHPTLIGLGQRCWPDTNATWAPSMRKGGDETIDVLGGLGRVFEAGVRVDWAAFDAPWRRRRVPLPTYPWQRQSYWSPAARPAHRTAPSSLWPVAVLAAERQAQQGPLDLQVERYEGRWRALDDLALAYIARAVTELRLFPNAGHRTSVRESLDRGCVAPVYAHLLGRWFGHLAEAGLLEPLDDDTFVSRSPTFEIDVDERRAAAVAACSGLEPLLEFVDRCGGRLAAVVAGHEAALSTLFPDGSLATTDFLYRDWAVPRYYNAIVGAAVGALSLARPAHELRVIEIGAGTGGTTAVVAPELPPERTSYTFTDVSDFFLARAAERFAGLSHMRFARLDIEQPPADQGFEPGTYDVVVAANVLHAARDLDEALAHARSLLAPGGVLMAIEATGHRRWFDVTTGLIGGWQRFADAWRRDVPLLAPDRWREALSAAGFVDVVDLPAEGTPTTILGQVVLLGRAPGDAAPPAPVRREGDVAARPVPARVEAQDAEALLAALDNALPDERDEVLVGAVRRAVAGVLRVGDPDRLRRDQPLLDMGFDSLMAVELRNVLRQALALEQKLPATLVFDHPTIASIASHLGGLLAGAPEASTDADSDRERTSRAPTLDASDVAALSDDEVEMMLLSRLSEIEP
jgi:acyl transferase domain-containing protein/SAM-dependent methyltransferase